MGRDDQYCESSAKEVEVVRLTYLRDFQDSSGAVSSVAECASCGSDWSLGVGKLARFGRRLRDLGGGLTTEVFR